MDNRPVIMRIAEEENWTDEQLEDAILCLAQGIDIGIDVDADLSEEDKKFWDMIWEVIEEIEE